MPQLCIILTLLITCFSFGQNFSRCEISYFNGADTLKALSYKTISYNLNGQMVSETYNGSADNGDFYFYKDTFLIKIISFDHEKDSLKTIHTYDAKGKRIKSEYYELKRQPKKKSFSLKKRKASCLRPRTEYEKEKTWKKISEINFKYDKNGNKILEDATKLHWDSQNKYTWKYNDKNQVIEHSSFVVDKHRDELYWTEKYEYQNSEYKFTTTIYDYDKNPRHLAEKSWEYLPQYTHTYKLNEKGKTIEEIVSDEKDKLFSRQITEYNDNGLISKITLFNQYNTISGIHLYKYIK